MICVSEELGQMRLRGRGNEEDADRRPRRGEDDCLKRSEEKLPVGIFSASFWPLPLALITLT